MTVKGPCWMGSLETQTGWLASGWGASSFTPLSTAKHKLQVSVDSLLEKNEKSSAAIY